MSSAAPSAIGRRGRGKQSAAPAPAVHRADTDDQERGRPERKREPEHGEGNASTPDPGTAGPEELLAVERELDRPEDERTGDRDRREGDDVTAAAEAAVRAEQPHRAVEERRQHPVGEGAGNRTREKRPDRDEQSVVVGIVEQVRRR